MTERRTVYFVYQGLLTIILFLFFLFERIHIVGWEGRFAFLVVAFGGMLVVLARVPMVWLTNPRVQTAWFLGDVILTSLTLQWIQQPTSDLYLIYFLVIFGTALTQNMIQSFLVAFLATLLYTYSTLRNSSGVTFQAEFWLRIPFLWIAASFTAMLSNDTRQEREREQLMYQERLFHMERLAALGQISAEVAHRIKAPLTTIRVNAEVLGHQPDTPKRMFGELKQIEDEVDHCKEILQKLLDLGRIEEMDSLNFDLQEVIQTAIDTIDPQLNNSKIQLRREGHTESAMMNGDPILVREAIVAVLQNAVEAMPDGGSLRLGLYWIKHGGWWQLRRRNPDTYDLIVEDSGAGIKAEELETIFRPFFTTKIGQGSGLGLSAALRILDKHHGFIKVSSEGLGKGASFTLSFPGNRVK